MEYSRKGNYCIVRIDPGEEIVSELTRLCQKEDIKLAGVSGIGAVDRVEMGLFDTVNKQYISHTYEGMFEIASLTGNISTMNGAVYLHLHITIGDAQPGHSVSGHLAKAYVSGTSEIIISVIDGQIDREFSPKIGLNLLKF